MRERPKRHLKYVERCQTRACDILGIDMPTTEDQLPPILVNPVDTRSKMAQMTVWSAFFFHKRYASQRFEDALVVLFDLMRSANFMLIAERVPEYSSETDFDLMYDDLGLARRVRTQRRSAGRVSIYDDIKPYVILRARGMLASGYGQLDVKRALKQQFPDPTPRSMWRWLQDAGIF